MLTRGGCKAPNGKPKNYKKDDILWVRGGILDTKGALLAPGGSTHWLMVYGDAQRFKGAFSSLWVYRWVVFC